MNNKEYSGWTNWDTWNVNLWLTNEEYSYKELNRCRNADQVKALWLEMFNNPDGVDNDAVNWQEIYEFAQDEETEEEEG